MKKINPIGQVYNKLTVIEEHSKTRNGHYRYVCHCECGNKTNVLLTHLRQGSTISCGCANKKGNQSNNWSGIGEISGSFWNHHIVRSATGEKGRRSSVDLLITKEFAWNLFLSQNKKCKLSGMEIKFPIINSDKSYTASLDRIDSSLGYTENNVQWVHKDINMMKRIYNNEYFINMCKLIAKNNE